jgi:hypothetical protein
MDGSILYSIGIRCIWSRENLDEIKIISHTCIPIVYLNSSVDSQWSFSVHLRDLISNVRSQLLFPKANFLLIIMRCYMFAQRNDPSNHSLIATSPVNTGSPLGYSYCTGIQTRRYLPFAFIRIQSTSHAKSFPHWKCCQIFLGITGMSSRHRTSTKESCKLWVSLLSPMGILFDI